MEGQERSPGRIVGGVDTHKDLHVAAVVDELDRVLASRCFATTRHGYSRWSPGWAPLDRSSVSVLRRPAPTVQDCCVTQKAAPKSLRSRRRTSMIVASAGKR